MGLNNIELISDRTLEVNLEGIARIKTTPLALFVSLMVESSREAWHDIVRRTQDVGVDGVELNFGCPHGMSERGMGAAVGQVPEYAKMITGWVKEVATVPVIVKLTPNVADVTAVGRAAVEGGADALSLINTINSVMGVDLDTLAPKPAVGGYGSHGGYCGPAVKPIALTWCRAWPTTRRRRADPRDRRHRGVAGRRRVPAAGGQRRPGLHRRHALRLPHRGWADRRASKAGCSEGFRTDRGCRRQVGPPDQALGELDLNYKVVAEIDQSKCIHCGLCYVACEDGCHQSIRWGCGGRSQANAFRRRSAGGVGPARRRRRLVNVFTIKQDMCVGCNMCSLVCPVEGCITMKPVDRGLPVMSWNEYQAMLAEGRVEKIEPPSMLDARSRFDLGGLPASR